MKKHFNRTAFRMPWYRLIAHKQTIWFVIMLLHVWIIVLFFQSYLQSYDMLSTGYNWDSSDPEWLMFFTYRSEFAINAFSVWYMFILASLLARFIWWVTSFWVQEYDPKKWLKVKRLWVALTILWYLLSHLVPWINYFSKDFWFMAQKEYSSVVKQHLWEKLDLNVWKYGLTHSKMVSGSLTNVYHYDSNEEWQEDYVVVHVYKLSTEQEQDSQIIVDWWHDWSRIRTVVLDNPNWTYEVLTWDDGRAEKIMKYLRYWDPFHVRMTY